MSETATAPGSHRSQISTLSGLARLSLFCGSIGFIIITLGVLFFGPEGALPDIWLTSLTAASVVCLLLAAIGRAPSGFEAGGFKMTFETDQVAELIATLRGSTTMTPEEKGAIFELIEKMTGSQVFTHAEAEVNDTYGSSPSASEKGRSPSASAKVAEDARSLLKDLADGGTLTEQYTVMNSGIGRPPTYEFSFTRNSRRVVVDTAQYWNNTSLKIAQRKAIRSLQKGTTVDAVVILCPDGGLDAYRQTIDNSHVLVTTLDDLSAESLDATIASQKAA